MDRLEKKEILINLLAYKDFDWFFQNICPHQIDSEYETECFGINCEDCMNDFLARCVATKQYAPVKF